MMRYDATAVPPTDRAVSAERTRWLRARRPAAGPSMDLLGQLASCWRNDDLRALRCDRRRGPGDEPEGTVDWSRPR